MKKFVEIFKKITLKETNKYPFLLAVKEDCDNCYNPVHIRGCRHYIDRAFVTTAGGYSVIPDDDPCAPDREPDLNIKDNGECADRFYYTKPSLGAAKEAPTEYTYWVLEDEKYYSCAFLRYTSEEINKAIKKKLDEIELEDPQEYKDSDETKNFINAVQKFLKFSAKSNKVVRLKNLLKKLRITAKKLQLEERNDAHFRSNFYYDTGEQEDDNLGIKYYKGFLEFEHEYWEQSLQLIKDAAKFEWDKEFAYYDLAGRAGHIAELNNIFDNRINCLFYVKWEEILKWYCKYMQPVVLTMRQDSVTNTQKVNNLFKICNKTYDKSGALYRYFDIKNNQALIQCSDTHYHPQDPINKNVSTNNCEFQIIFQNIYFFTQNEPKNWERIIEFNSLSIAKNIRLFGEFSLMFLYYKGYIPAYCNGYGIVTDYFDKKYQKFQTYVCAKNYPPLKKLYGKTSGLIQCLDNISDLLKEEVGSTMHNDFLWDKNVLMNHLTLMDKILCFLDGCP